MSRKLLTTRIRKYLFSGLTVIVLAGISTACSQLQTTWSNPTGISDQQYALDRLKIMSDTIGAANQFRIQTQEVHEWVDEKGEKSRLEGTSTVDVLRPGAMKVTVQASGAQDLDSTLYFYESTLAFEGRNKEFWAAASTQETIDAMLDEISWRFDLPIPVSDFLYTSAYDSLITEDTQGKWTDRVTIGNQAYDHFVFSAEGIHWEIWLTTDEAALPHQMKLFRKDVEGDPKSVITFTRIDLNHELDSSDFIFIPKDGYTQIAVTENPSIDEEIPSSQGGE